MKEKMTLTDRFISLLAGNEDNEEMCGKVADMVMGASDSPERTGLMAYLYHEGIGVEEDLERAFELTEKAAFEGGDPLGYFLLGFMCDNAETPDQKEGGPRQKYDHYDAERFYDICAGKESRWQDEAILWMGDYYMDSTHGGDPEIGVEYYERIAERNRDAAAALSDYYWDLVMPEYFEDDDWREALFKWTRVAVGLDPEEYSYRMGWLYADGIGCEPSPEEARHFFQTAYLNGDWRGAQAIAVMLTEEIEANTEMSAEDRKRHEADIRKWRGLADKLHQEEIDSEPDPSEEED